MQPLTEILIKVLAELIVFGLLFPFRRLKSIDKNVTAMRRELIRVNRRVDVHDKEAGIDTRARPRLRLRKPDAPTA